eukprot:EG_transcript_5265
MHIPGVPKFGSVELGSLKGESIFDTESTPWHNTLVQLAAVCCRVSGAAIMLIDDGQMLCKAQWGVLEPFAEVDKCCRRVLWQPEPTTYLSEPAAPSSAFWAGAPIFLPDTDSCVGVLVVMDALPNTHHSPELSQLLELLAAQAAHFIGAEIRVSSEWQRMNLFIAKVSHELRTPLNGILGCAAVLQGRLGSGDGETAATLGHISKSAEHNLQTVNQILDFAKLDAGRVELERLTFDLRECVEEAMAMLPLHRKAVEVELGYEMAEDAEVVGDPHRLKQVLLNLLSNALKFTTQGSVVLSVQLRPASPNSGLGHSGRGCVHFTVRDTGVGIAPEVAQNLFRPYSQGSASTARTHGGTGLGLAISRMLAEAMGGRLWLESTVGEGSAFHFTAAVPLRPTLGKGFPGCAVLLVDEQPTRAMLLQHHLESLDVTVHHSSLSTAGRLPPDCDLILMAGTPAAPLPAWPVPWALVADLPASEASPREASPRAGGAAPAFVLPAVISQRRLRRQLEALWVPLSPPPLLPLPPATSPRPSLQWAKVRELAGLRVLVADDVEVNRAVLQSFLKHLDCVVDVRTNGAEAVEAIESATYDVAVLDLQMPVLDGFDAARHVRALPRVPALVAASSTPGELVHSQCLEAGFDTFLQKPIRFDELCRVLLEVKRVVSPASSGQSLSSSDWEIVVDPSSQPGSPSASAS